jgi:hypothetical protein
MHFHELALILEAHGPPVDRPPYPELCPPYHLMPLLHRCGLGLAEAEAGQPPPFHAHTEVAHRQSWLLLMLRHHLGEAPTTGSAYCHKNPVLPGSHHAATAPGEPQLPVSIATSICELQSQEGRWKDCSLCQLILRRRQFYG